MIKDQRFWIESRPYYDGYSLYLAGHGPGGELFAAQPIEFKQTEEGMYIESCLRITRNEGQLLIDALWSVGLRPTEGTGSAGSLRATEKHLQDMQNLSWRLLTMIEKSNG